MFILTPSSVDNGVVVAVVSGALMDGHTHKLVNEFVIIEL